MAGVMDIFGLPAILTNIQINKIYTKNKKILDI